MRYIFSIVKYGGVVEINTKKKLYKLLKLFHGEKEIQYSIIDTYSIALQLEVSDEYMEAIDKKFEVYYKEADINTAHQIDARLADADKRLPKFINWINESTVRDTTDALRALFTYFSKVFLMDINDDTIDDIENDSECAMIMKILLIYAKMKPSGKWVVGVKERE